VNARQRIRRMTSRAQAYLFASEIRGYLEEKTRVGTEHWVFPVAGDLFLDALEANLDSIGPNLFKDHYSAAMGCYKQGDQPAKMVETPLYVVDLLLDRSIAVFLTRGENQQPEGGMALSFMVQEENGDFRKLIGIFISMARQCVEDAVEALSTANWTVPKDYVEFITEVKGQLDDILRQWETFHKNAELDEMGEEDYLLKGIEIAERISHKPLSGLFKERLADLYHREGRREILIEGLDEPTHNIYTAACIYLEYANTARDASAYNLALRFYNRAFRTYIRIHDRTCAAKALVEKARAYIKNAEEKDEVRRNLHEAVRLVIAHIKNLPYGTLPPVADDAAIRFLEKKGYHIEAKAYKEALDSAK